MSEERGIGARPNSENALSKGGKNWLLVVGIDKYADSAVPTLQNAVRDTEHSSNTLSLSNLKVDFNVVTQLFQRSTIQCSIFLNDSFMGNSH